MLRIITGRAGSGKSARCISEFNAYIQKHISADKWAYLFVPEQYTMLTERRLLEFQVNEGYTSLGLIGHEVLNFKRFTHRILSMYGGSAFKMLSESGKIMLLTAACSSLSGSLNYFTSISERPAEAARMLSLIDELGRYGINKSRLEGLHTSDTYLDKKLSDINLILNKYKEMKKGIYTDENDLFEMMLCTVERIRFFKDRRVWIDSFTGFTSKEMELISVMLTQCESVTVSLCTDLSEEPAFECVNKTFAALKDMAERRGSEINIINLSLDPESNRYKYKYTALHMLEQSITKARAHRIHRGSGGAYAPYDCGAADSIRLYECMNPYDETERCAVRIKELHEKEHIEYKHIAVALRDTSGYDFIIKAIFSKYNIPFYIDDKKSINNNPFIKTVLSLLAIIADNWQMRDVLECIKAGIIMPAVLKEQPEEQPEEQPKEKSEHSEESEYSENLEESEQSEDAAGEAQVADKAEQAARAGYEVENEMLAMGLKGASRWRKNQNKYCAALYTYVNALASDLSECTSLSDACASLCKFIVEHNIKSILDALYSEMLEKGNESGSTLADEYSRIWNIFTDVTEQIELFLGDTCTDSAQNAASVMIRYLTAGFAHYKIGFLPPDTDSVQVISIERSRSAEIKALFLLGANEGILPAHFTDDGILRDSEREILSENGIELADDSRSKAAKENYYIYITLSLPDERLEISWPLEDISGNSMKPSSVILRKIRAVFPDITVNIKNSVMSESEHYKPERDIYIAPAVNSDIFRLDGILRTNVSKIEAYYKCPFCFMLSYGLGLKKRNEAGIEAYDMGNIMHNIVDCASDALLKLSSESDFEKYTELVESVYDEAASEMRFSKRELTERESHALGRIRSYAANALYNIKRQIEAGSFKTAGFEAAFDNSNSTALNAIELIPEIKRPVLEKISISGRIDRYDVMESDGRFFVRVIDYKSSGVSLNEDEIRAGTKLQLITYLNAVVDSYADKKAEPAGALYFTFGSGISSEKLHISSCASPENKNRFKMNGFVLADNTVLDGMTGGSDTGVIGGRVVSGGALSFQNSKMLKSEEEFINMRNIVFKNIKNAAEEISDGHFPISPSEMAEVPPCRYCDMISVCANCRKLD